MQRKSEEKAYKCADSRRDTEGKTQDGEVRLTIRFKVVQPARVETQRFAANVIEVRGY